MRVINIIGQAQRLLPYGHTRVAVWQALRQAGAQCRCVLPDNFLASRSCQIPHTHSHTHTAYNCGQFKTNLKFNEFIKKSLAGCTFKT